MGGLQQHHFLRVKARAVGEIARRLQLGGEWNGRASGGTSDAERKGSSLIAVRFAVRLEIAARPPPIFGCHHFQKNIHPSPLLPGERDTDPIEGLHRAVIGRSSGSHLLQTYSRPYGSLTGKDSPPQRLD